MKSATQQKINAYLLGSQISSLKIYTFRRSCEERKYIIVCCCYEKRNDEVIATQQVMPCNTTACIKITTRIVL
jgi:hypothetical protein